MGYIKLISCRNCNSEWECEEGSGKMGFDIENVIPLFPKALQHKLL